MRHTNKEMQLKQVSPLTLDAIQAEVIRAQAKHKTRTPINPLLPWGQKLAILVEEVGEVATAASREAPTELVGELLQVAAMAAAWVESIEGNHAE